MATYISLLKHFLTSIFPVLPPLKYLLPVFPFLLSRSFSCFYAERQRVWIRSIPSTRLYVISSRPPTRVCPFPILSVIQLLNKYDIFVLQGKALARRSGHVPAGVKRRYVRQLVRRSRYNPYPFIYFLPPLYVFHCATSMSSSRRPGNDGHALLFFSYLFLPSMMCSRAYNYQCFTCAPFSMHYISDA